MSRQGLRLLAAGLVVIGTLAAVFATRLGDGESTGYAALSGSPAPDLTLHRLNGDGSVNLSDLSDTHQVVVVNFFASWCLQCRNEHPDLVSTAAAYQDRSVRFVGVSFQDDPSRSTAFLDELGRGNETEYLTDPGSRAAIEFGIFGVPETVFLSNGVIAGKFLGETDASTLSQALEQLLSGEAIDSRQVGEFRQDPTSDR
ncbi:MAG: TlpA family protein disulfide reductase [Acidimicrobiia bacterium]|nr:TlpA family protein disulfide reductase [Acidimicrobiia bacterium]